MHFVIYGHDHVPPSVSDRSTRELDTRDMAGFSPRDESSRGRRRVDAPVGALTPRGDLASALGAGLVPETDLQREAQREGASLQQGLAGQYARDVSGSPWSGRGKKVIPCLKSVIDAVVFNHNLSTEKVQDHGATGGAGSASGREPPGIHQRLYPESGAAGRDLTPDVTAAAPFASSLTDFSVTESSPRTGRKFLQNCAAHQSQVGEVVFKRRAGQGMDAIASAHFDAAGARGSLIGRSALNATGIFHNGAVHGESSGRLIADRSRLMRLCPSDSVANCLGWSGPPSAASSCSGSRCSSARGSGPGRDCHRHASAAGGSGASGRASAAPSFASADAADAFPRRRARSAEHLRGGWPEL